MKHTDCNKYRIGLDIGTGSVGWAVTDTDNNLLQFRGKNMWGVRLFENAKTAAERRIFRSARRRLARRRQRIDLLQSLLAPMVFEIDPDFFRRMDQTFLQTEDKDSDLQGFAYLFNSLSDYQKKYKTVYHLRSDLIHTKDPFDPRLVYLALHHIIKYRGNFLYEGKTFSEQGSEQTEALATALADAFANNLSEEEMPAGLLNALPKMAELLDNHSLTRARLRDSIKSLCDGKPMEEIAKALSGYKFKFNTIVGEDLLLDDKEKPLSLEFNAAFDDKADEFYDALGDYADILKCLKQLHDRRLLQTIIKGEKYISDALINRYNEHKEQLRQLKQIFRTYFSKADYNKMFRDKSVADNYVNYARYGLREDWGKSAALRDAFYNSIKKILETKKESYTPEDKEIYESILTAIDQNEYLLKLRISENGAIPYQLHQKELEEIINNQGAFYPVLLENKEKLIKLLNFRVPYYAGPLNRGSSFSWFSRKAEGNIYPWNAEEIVDMDKSAADFVTRMLSVCTYVPKDPDGKPNYVLPRFSLLFSEYAALNELNKVRIRGRLINRAIKQDLIENHFKKQNSVSVKDLKNVLQKCGETDWKTVEITGLSDPKKFLNNMKSYKDFTSILGGITAYDKPMIEKIILWLTVYEDTDIVKRRVQKEYGSRLTEEQINKICSLKYSGWGSLSRAFLEDITGHDEDKNARTGETCSVIELLRHSNHNLMEIINFKSFRKSIDDYNGSTLGAEGKISFEDIKQLAGSPALKRGIWQSVKIVEEIVEIMGFQPESIWLEAAREEGEKGKRTTSRLDKVKELYKTLAGDSDFMDVYKELQNESEESLRSNRLFLYYLQGGKCMYSGKPLDINQLNTYQVDHIIPRSLIKDDSINNTVLVIQSENQRKADSWVLDRETQIRMGRRWEALKEKGLLTQEKYFRLTRTEMKKEELEGFINRQLVETRQIVKHVANMLSERFPKTEERLATRIMTVKAKILSDFREKYKIFKIRELNDLHHAQDAYICLTIGNFLSKAYPGYANEYDWEKYLRFDPDHDIRDINNKGWGFILSKMNFTHFIKDTGEVTWDKDTEMPKALKTLSYKDCRITKKTERLTGAFTKQTILPKTGKEKDAGLARLKRDLPAGKYGYYDYIYKAYFMAVEYNVRNGRSEKTFRELVGMPVQYDYLIQKGHASKQDLLVRLLKESISKGILIEESIRVLRDDICVYQNVEQNGHPLQLTSATYYINAKPLFVDSKYLELLFWLCEENSLMKKKEQRNDMLPKLKEFTSYYVDKLEKEYPVYVNFTAKLRGFITPGADGLSEFDKLPDIPEDLSKPGKSKEDFVKKILKLSQIASCQLDMKKQYGLTTGFGMLNGFKLTDDTVFIDQSITGLFEKRTSLWAGEQ